MRKEKRAALLLAALLLTGCAARSGQDAAPAASAAPEQTAAPALQGALGELTQALLSAYEAPLAQAEQENPSSLSYAIPGDVLGQMARDAWDVGAQSANGRWAFTWRGAGEYTYQATADDAALPGGEATPDPTDETPMDSQLNGDYAVSGGGLFKRQRVYDAAADLSSGEAEISDSLNGTITGYELFRFCVRDGNLYFSDAAADYSVSAGQGQIYLAAVGVLRPDGLEAVEYVLEDLAQLPNPSQLNWSAFLASTEAVARVSVACEQK